MVERLDCVIRELFGTGYRFRAQLPLDLGQTTEPEPDFVVGVGVPLAATTAGHPTRALLVIEVSERPEELLAALTASGLSVALSGHQVMTVEIADNTTYDVVRDAVAELGVPLIRLQQARHHMVDIFRDDSDIRQQESA